MAQGTPQLELRGVTKRFGTTAAAERISFSVYPGEFLSLLGPSGCGKTTTLRMIAGFVDADEGQILFQGRDITRLPPYRRDVGMVFQSYALFPHMTVGDNVAFGLRMRRAAKQDIQERVQWALELVRLPGFNDRKPSQLSGGQQQRVAVARVLAAGASVLLFDEPFSNLDAKLRKDMQVEMRDLQQRLQITTVHVTHDQEEAMSMSDRLIIMNAGRLEQDGTPSEIYRSPRTGFVADFIGRCNRLRGRITPLPSTISPRSVRLMLDTGHELEATWGGSGNAPDHAAAYVRPEHIKVGSRGSFQGQPNVLSAVMRRTVYVGATTTLHVGLSNSIEIIIDMANPPEETVLFAPGEIVDLYVPPLSLRLLSDMEDEGPNG